MLSQSKAIFINSFQTLRKNKSTYCALFVLTLLCACSDPDVSVKTDTTNKDVKQQVDTNNSSNSSDSSEEVASSGIPNSDIYLASLNFVDGHIELGVPVNITQHFGYDNQPFFMPGNEVILYTSRRGDTEEQASQSDIYAYSIKNGKSWQVTNTLESEYSPTLTPSGETISVVRVDLDSKQRLWEFPLQPGLVTSKEFSIVFPELDRVGYHAWTNADTAYVFLVDKNPEGSKHTLEVVTRDSGKTIKIASSIGRSLALQPEENKLSFIDKSDEEDWVIKLYDPSSTFAVKALSALKGSEDLAWLDKEHLLMAKGNSIYLNTVQSKYGVNWKAVGAEKTALIKGEISRLAVSPDGKWLALVVTP